tara:strand:- start:351 stop:572 length:222 start_codon:yes stop_codon:yes gene_type:complete
MIKGVILSDKMFAYVIFSLIPMFFFVGVHAANKHHTGKAKKDDCEQMLVLRAEKCKPYYLTTEEIKLIERLGE